jgi:hypothetical protein
MQSRYSNIKDASIIINASNKQQQLYDRRNSKNDATTGPPTQ